MKYHWEGKGYKWNYQSYFVGIFVQNNLLKMNGLVDIQLGLNYIFLNFLPIHISARNGSGGIIKNIDSVRDIMHIAYKPLGPLKYLVIRFFIVF